MIPVSEIIGEIQNRCQGARGTCSLVVVGEHHKHVDDLLKGLSDWSRQGGWPFRAPHDSVSDAGLSSELGKGMGGVMAITSLNAWSPRQLKEIGNSIRANQHGLPLVFVGLDFDPDLKKKKLEDIAYGQGILRVAGLLGAPVIRIDEDGVIEGERRTQAAGPSAADVATVNRHRAGLGMRPLDLAHGWSAQEIADMADSIRRTGRTHNPLKLRVNPAKLKRRLLR